MGDYVKRRRDQDIRPNEFWKEQQEEKKVQKTLDEYPDKKLKTFLKEKSLKES